ncbi:hypothetical protein SAMN05216353_1141, partial [Halobacillus alkaliphilus]
GNAIDLQKNDGMVEEKAPDDSMERMEIA